MLLKIKGIVRQAGCVGSDFCARRDAAYAVLERLLTDPADKTIFQKSISQSAILLGRCAGFDRLVHDVRGAAELHRRHRVRVRTDSFSDNGTS